ncbi:hypothetical protein [Paludibaculum fermentans]|uniref:Uncharacterized protein n=1 Tax=Paludibaculum fermentans TaxID=1473598 RepID=A0A7S7NR24_PALFE|nr:hypothetical protein [Paludibaculum fermentans]QOY88212.1 hypothetical protein IRI77_36670 [Paludibaculum fermentans]
MPAYHQMGHDSENLLWADGLAQYGGAILSPVNYDQVKMAAQIAWGREQANFETLFDPQMYVPNSERGRLRDWPYFPNDVDTADLASDSWWSGLLDALVNICTEIGPTAVCSPAVLPASYPDEYFARMVTVGDQLVSRLVGTAMRPMQTAVVGLPELATPDRALAIGSILSRSKTSHIYLVLVSLAEPRRELAEVEEIKGAMRLIAALRAAGIEVTVGFSSSDVVLWKAAGATHCATGKFFNLRRFTRTRFEEPRGQGGGQLPYWFDESLMAFLRQSDLLRVLPMNLPSLGTSVNPFAEQILGQLATEPERAWLALAWRQFLFWFADIENRLDGGSVIPAGLLRNADGNWRTLDDADVLMEERRNDGGWLRPWRRALAEFLAP